MASRIPLIEPVVGDEELSNIKSVFDSGYLTQGPYAEEMEEKFASMVNAKHAITTTSCTVGIELALEGLKIGSGNQVIVPDFTYPATATAVERVGASPVLVDVDGQTYNIDPEEVAAAVTEDTAAILPVAWGGQPLNHEPLQEIAADHDLAIVEDAACSVKASFDRQPVGSQFNASVFSFHPRKVLTTGEGGMITTDDDDLAREIRSIKNFGTDPMGDRHGFFKAQPSVFRYPRSCRCRTAGESRRDRRSTPGNRRAVRRAAGGPRRHYRTPSHRRRETQLPELLCLHRSRRRRASGRTHRCDGGRRDRNPDRNVRAARYRGVR